jgi:hypothetical protein
VKSIGRESAAVDSSASASRAFKEQRSHREEADRGADQHSARDPDRDEASAGTSPPTKRIK